MEVPPETLGRILACLDKKDLKEVRLVCKKLERSAVSLLFDEIYLSTNPAEIEIAQNTIRSFGKSIKTVFFSAVVYKEMKWGNFKNAVRRSRHYVEFLRLAYTNYCRLRQEQQDMLRAGTYFGHLLYALRTIPNAQRLVITDFEATSCPREWERRRSRLWRVGDCPTHCSIQGCARGNLYHLSGMHRSRKPFRTVTTPFRTVTHEPDLESAVAYAETQDNDPWALVMMGLAATGSYLLIHATLLSTLDMLSISTRL